VKRALVVATSLAVLTLLAVPVSAATADDRQLAKVGVLQLTDFPTGWKQSARRADSSIDTEAAKIRSCTAYVAFRNRFGKNPHAESPLFERGNAGVANKTSVYTTSKRSSAAMKVFGSPDTPRCYEAVASVVYERRLRRDKKVAKQLEGVTTNLARVEGVRIGDDAVVYQGTVDVRSKGGSITTISVGLVGVRVGAALTTYSYTTDTDISAALQPAIVASVTRLQRAAPSA
jgi:hypothetical protein